MLTLPHRSTLSSISPPTRRELLLLILCTIIFSLLLQTDFSTTRADGTRKGVLGLKVWKVGSGDHYDNGDYDGGYAYGEDGRQGEGGGGKSARLRKAEQILLNGLLGDGSGSKNGDWTHSKSLDGIIEAYEDVQDDVRDDGSENSRLRLGTVLSKLGLTKQMTMNDSLTRWGESDTSKIPRTEVVTHAPGWTVFRNLYLLNGTWYIVTDSPSDFPLLRMMTSTGKEIWNDQESIKSREPTDKDMKIIFPSEARRLLGTHASKVAGTSWICNDPPQFLDHYYHMAAELLFGLWRTYSSLDQKIESDGVTLLASPRRFMFTHAKALEWRDYSHMNTFMLKAVFPSMSYEFADEFADRAKAARPYIYDRIVFADRAAALRGAQFAHTWRTASEAFTLNGSPYWWSPVRRNLLEFIGVPESTLHPADSATPVITYVSRQDWGRRMLRKEDDAVLVKALNGLHDKYGYEVNIVSMDKLSRDEQLRLAARTTIMLGVHGNGLTHLLWMKPTPRATVIEFFFPGGFAHDYEFTSRALGISHYGFWGDHYFTAPDTPEVAYPDGFQGNEIPVDGNLVAELIHARLTIPVETAVVHDIEQAEQMELENPEAMDDESDPAVFDDGAV